MHLKRWITGLTALPFLVLLLSKGGVTWLALVVAAVSILGLREYFRLIFEPFPNGQPAPSDPAQVELHGMAPHRFCYLSYLIAPAWVLATALFDRQILAILIPLLFTVFVGAAIVGFQPGAGVIDGLFKHVVGFLYIPFLLSHLVLIRNGSDGIAWMYFLLCVVFAGDTGAYYAGSYRGRHKLCPSVSPGKTVEGSIGGLVSNAVIGLLFKWLFLPALGWQTCIWLCLSVGVAGQIGDLFESMLKRQSGIKDSGTLFPGHGGVLDRVDALLFAAPVAYWFKVYAV